MFNDYTAAHKIGKGTLTQFGKNGSITANALLKMNPPIRLPDPHSFKFEGKRNLTLVFTLSGKASVSEKEGLHTVIGILDEDQKPMGPDEVDENLVGAAFPMAIVSAKQFMKSEGFRGFRIEGNYGDLCHSNRPFHMHFIFIRPGVETRRSVDRIVIDKPSPPPA